MSFIECIVYLIISQGKLCALSYNVFIYQRSSINGYGADSICFQFYKQPNFTIQNFYEYDKIKNSELTEDKILISLDVRSLFSSVPIS